jgi:hypothetical protein
MLKNWKAHLLVCVLLALCAFVVWRSYAFQHCIQESKGYAGGQTIKERATNIFPFLNAYLGCTGEFLHKNAEAITGLFTLILAISTILLWRVTRTAAEAAKLTAQAVIDADRAYLFPEIGGHNITAMIETAATIKGPDDGTRVAIHLSYSFKNYGRTPAIIRAISQGAVIAPELPDERTSSVVVHLPCHILAADKSTPQIQVTPLPVLTSTVAKSIRDIENTFWFYGCVVYDDTFGWRRTMKFVFHVDAVSEGFTIWDWTETKERRES